MGSTLEHGIYLPSEGEKNCYSGLANNWQTVDTNIGYVTALRQAIAGALTRQVVTQLPTEDIDTNCIYMILKATAQTSNIYDEYMYINSNWELIGDSQLDLSNYYTKQEVNQLPAVASGVTSTKVGNYDAHIANGDIHVTASDKAKWNTVALIKQLRLVNTQVGSATTIAFADIDDTNGIKVGDKCMDLDGKMFEITAVDTTNQTVTVGSALIDLALDANVMHLSGNETVGGNKTFSNTPVIYNSDTLGSTANLYLRNQLVTKGDTSTGGSQLIRFSDSSDKMLSRIQASKVSNGSTTLNLRADTVDTNNNDVTTEIQLISGRDGSKSLSPQNDNAIDLGRTLAKWKNIYSNQINGLTPSSLSLPSDNIANIIDISGYLTNLDGTQNNYTAPVNGWIAISMNGCSGIQAYINGLWGNQIVIPSAGGVRFLMPVVKNLTVNILIFGGAIDNARFIPCQGNV